MAMMAGPIMHSKLAWDGWETVSMTHTCPSQVKLPTLDGTCLQKEKSV